MHISAILPLSPLQVTLFSSVPRTLDGLSIRLPSVTMGPALWWAPVNGPLISSVQQPFNIIPILQMSELRTKEVKKHSWASQLGQGSVRIPMLVPIKEWLFWSLTHPTISTAPLPSYISAVSKVKQYACCYKGEPRLPPDVPTHTHSKPPCVRILKPSPQRSVLGVPCSRPSLLSKLCLGLGLRRQSTQAWLREACSGSIPGRLGSGVCLGGQIRALLLPRWIKDLF